MKFSFAYVKQNPYMFGAIALVFGVFVYIYLNRSADAAAVTVAGNSSGLSDAELAAQTQMGMAQLQVGAQTQLAGIQLQALAQDGANQVALASISRDVDLAVNAANERIQAQSITASLAALAAQLDTQQHMNDSNNQFQIDYASIAADNALSIVETNAALARAMSADQLEGFKQSALIAAIGMAPESTRTNLLLMMNANATGAGVNYSTNHGKDVFTVTPRAPVPAPVPALPNSSNNIMAGGGALLNG